MVPKVVLQVLILFYVEQEATIQITFPLPESTETETVVTTAGARGAEAADPAGACAPHPLGSPRLQSTSDLPQD